MVPSFFVDVGRYVVPGINVFLNTIRKEPHLFPHRPLKEKTQKHIDASCWCLQSLGLLLTVSNSGSNFQGPRELQRLGECLISYLVSKRENTSSSKALCLFMDVCRVQFTVMLVSVTTYWKASWWLIQSEFLGKTRSCCTWCFSNLWDACLACELCHWWKGPKHTLR